MAEKPYFPTEVFDGVTNHMFCVENKKTGEFEIFWAPIGTTSWAGMKKGWVFEGPLEWPPKVPPEKMWMMEAMK